MNDAVDYLRNLADRTTARRPLLDVCRIVAAPGPAMGPAVRGRPQPRGLNLEAALHPILMGRS